jgi:hypothetical protein
MTVATAEALYTAMSQIDKELTIEETPLRKLKRVPTSSSQAR